MPRCTTSQGTGCVRARHRRLERRTFGLADDYRHQLASPVHSHRVSRLARRAFSLIRLGPKAFSVYLFGSNGYNPIFCCSSNRLKYLHFPNDFARVIHNADAGRLDRNVQSSKMIHAALPLLMLEAIHTDLVPPSA